MRKNLKTFAIDTELLILHFLSHTLLPYFTERFVATFKQHMKKCIADSSASSTTELWRAARQVLFMYRCMPHPELDGYSPAEMLHGRRPKNLLSLLASEQERKPENRRQSGKCPFPSGTNVFFRNYGKGPRWLPGTVTEVRGRVVRMIESDGGLVKRHTNQLQMRIVEEDTGTNQASGDVSRPDQPRLLRSVLPSDQMNVRRNPHQAATGSTSK